MEQWPGRKSLSLTVWPSIALMQVPACGAPWRVPAEEHHQPWDQLLSDHRAHHLDPVWDSGGRIYRGRPGRLQSACHRVHAAGRWDLVPLSHSQCFLLPNSCYFYQPPCFHLLLFISGGRKHAGLNRLMQYLFTCYAEVNLVSNVDATFILEPSSQTANFHANPLQNNYANYLPGRFSLQMRRIHLRKFRVFSFGHLDDYLGSGKCIDSALRGFICLIILNRRFINRVCQAVEWYWCSSAEPTHN